MNLPDKVLNKLDSDFQKKVEEILNEYFSPDEAKASVGLEKELPVLTVVKVLVNNALGEQRVDIPLEHITDMVKVVSCIEDKTTELQAYVRALLWFHHNKLNGEDGGSFETILNSERDYLSGNLAEGGTLVDNAIGTLNLVNQETTHLDGFLSGEAVEADEKEREEALQDVIGEVEGSEDALPMLTDLIVGSLVVFFGNCLFLVTNDVSYYKEFIVESASKASEDFSGCLEDASNICYREYLVNTIGEEKTVELFTKLQELEDEFAEIAQSYLEREQQGLAS